MWQSKTPREPRKANDDAAVGSRKKDYAIAEDRKTMTQKKKEKEKAIDWDALGSSEGEKNEKEEVEDAADEEKKEKAKMNWDDLSEEDEGEEDEGEEKKGEGMFDYLDALISEDEEEVEMNDEARKMDEQIKLKILSALHNEAEEEVQYQQTQQQKKKEKALEKTTASTSSSSQEPKKEGKISKFLHSSRAKEKSKTRIDKELSHRPSSTAIKTSHDSPSVPSHVIHYVHDTWVKDRALSPKPLKQAYLHKSDGLSHHSKHAQRKWCVVAAHDLRFYDKFGDSEPQGSIPFQSITSVTNVARSPDEDDLFYTIEITCRDHTQHHFMATSKKEQNEWTKVLQESCARSPRADV